ncbi:MAG: hypothetical protein Q9209_001827 [Squamulea sp. 1 TL-2023]
MASLKVFLRLSSSLVPRSSTAEQRSTIFELSIIVHILEYIRLAVCTATLTEMRPLQHDNFTRISTTNIIHVSRWGRRTASQTSDGSSIAENPRTTEQDSTLISASNIIDGPDQSRKTRRGSATPRSAVRTTSTRQETRHDPMTRIDRAARNERTTRGRKSRTKLKSNARTRRDPQGDEDTAMNTVRSRDTNILRKSDGNAARTVFKGPTARQMLKALEDSLADADTAADEQENSGAREPEATNILEASNGNAAPKAVFVGPTAYQMLEALEESIAVADRNLEKYENDGARQLRDITDDAVLARPSRTEDGDERSIRRSPLEERVRVVTGITERDTATIVPITSRSEPTTSSSSSGRSRELSAAPSHSGRILTYPNGPNMPPLITYLQTPSPTQDPHRPRSPSPLRFTHREKDTVLPTPSANLQIPLPLPPTPDRPGLVLHPPSRPLSPIETYHREESWLHQPEGLGSLVVREGGYRMGSIRRWPSLPDRIVEKMRERGMDVRGEMILVSGEGEGGVDSGRSAGERMERGGKGDGEVGVSGESEVGDPGQTTIEDLDGLLEGF